MDITKSGRPDSSKALQVSLYSGIALVVISMLFLGKQQSSASFGIQALTVLAAPIFFFTVGSIVYRYLNAPLAGPGIVATGTWLLGVDLIHLYVQRTLLPQVIQPYFWLTMSVVAGILITLIGYRVRVWMHNVLVPLVQVNAMWSVMGALGMTVEWMLPLSFGLVLVWWEWPHKDARWRSVYRIAASTLAAFLLILPVLLQLPTSQTLMVTWAVGAATVAFLGVRYGWLNLGPLALLLLTGASTWGLAPAWWPLAWLVLAVLTILFIERIATDDGDRTDATATQLAQALAVLLAGGAALFAETAPIFLGVSMHPLGVASALLGSGSLLAWLGWHRDLRMAAHAGLWLIASGWSTLYAATIPATHTFGLWLALLASAALFVERVLTSRRKEKGKAAHSLRQTMTYWPLADLVIGLSTFTLLWTAFSIETSAPAILIVTFAVIIGVWVAAGLIYRLPILLHIALWIAPLPYALLLLLVAPALWTLPLLGIAWQILGVGLLVFGHSVPKYRPAVLLPFFIVGYTLIGFGFSLAMGSTVFLPLSLTIVVIASIGTSAAVIAGRHVAWDYLLSYLFSGDRLPFANRHIRHAFLLLAAWVTAVWLDLLLGYSGLALPAQGLSLVLFASIWFAIGRVLARFPNAVSWPVATAGWLMWAIGLLEVFYAPREALIAIVLGCLVSGESLRRTRQIAWIPVVIVQLLFSVLQIAWLLALPGYVMLFAAAIGISVLGLFVDTRAPRSGRITALTGGVVALGIVAYHPDSAMLTTIGLLIAVATAHYRRWQGVLAVYPAIAAVITVSHITVSWQGFLALGLIQLVIGVELLRVLRARRFRTLKTALFREFDWATPLLWMGTVCSGAAFKLAFDGQFDGQPASDTLIAILISLAVSIFLCLRLRIARLPYVPVVLVGIGLALVGISYFNQPFSHTPDDLLSFALGSVLSAIVIHIGMHYLLRHSAVRRKYPWIVWWLRPMLALSMGLAGGSMILLITFGSSYSADTFLKIATGIWLAAFALLLLIHTRQRSWLWLSLVWMWYVWEVLVFQMRLTAIVWQTLPLGMALLLIDKWFYPKTVKFDLIGCAILLSGAVIGLENANLISPAGLAVVLHVGGLAAYGYLAGRRIPFAIAMLMSLTGLICAVAIINIWFIPLAGGVLLMAGALLVEVRRESTERWVTDWNTRWQLWQ